MNKTININLGGTFFHIDENAYNHLRSYLEAVRATLSPEDSIAEIMDDIEARIAELFKWEKRQEAEAAVAGGDGSVEEHDGRRQGDRRVRAGQVCW